MDTISNERTSMEVEYHSNKLPARLLAVGEVACFLGVHSSTVRRWEKRGLLRSYVIGLRGNLRFKQEDVLGLLDKCQKTGTLGLPLDSGLDRRTQSGRLGGGELGGRDTG